MNPPGQLTTVAFYTRQLLKDFRLQHQEMNVYKMRFAEHR